MKLPLLLLLTLLIQGSWSCRPARDTSAVNQELLQIADSVLTPGINQFSSGVFRLVSQSPDNVVISPFSLSTALSMLLLGARGQSEQLLTSKLGFENVQVPCGPSVHELFREVSVVLTQHLSVCQ